VFEPNDAVLWRSLNATVSAFLSDFWTQGGLRGDTPSSAYFVKCDGELNTLSVIDEGKVIIEVGVALQRPAEFVVIKIGQFDGGATVTVTA
jgi:phage tail sheath protein FI